MKIEITKQDIYALNATSEHDLDKWLEKLNAKINSRQKRWWRFWE